MFSIIGDLVWAVWWPGLSLGGLLVTVWFLWCFRWIVGCGYCCLSSSAGWVCSLCCFRDSFWWWLFGICDSRWVVSGRFECGVLCASSFDYCVFGCCRRDLSVCVDCCVLWFDGIACGAGGLRVGFGCVVWSRVLLDMGFGLAQLGVDLL